MEAHDNHDGREIFSCPKEAKLASFQDVFSLGNGCQTHLLTTAGLVVAVISGALGPLMIWYFAKSFKDLSGDPRDDDYLKTMAELAYAYMVLGVIAFISQAFYHALLQTSAEQRTFDLKRKWFQALLRQDQAYFDIKEVSGVATTISINAAKFQRGIGIKMGLLAQFVATFLGGMIYAFSASWQTTLIVLLAVPFMAISGWFLVKLTTSQSQRRNETYAKAGGIVFTTVTSIRTILSLNGVHAMIDKFQEATASTYLEAVRQVYWLGVANGSVMTSFLLSSMLVPLFGGYLLYDQVRDNGCDPSGAVPDVPTCNPSGMDILGAMFGTFFAASVLPQISTFVEALNDARAACTLALEVMDRKVDTITKPACNDRMGGTVRRHVGRQNHDEFITQSILPHYVIDSSSPDGKKPIDVNGTLEFQKVSFSYPTRIEANILIDFSLRIEAGMTVALVGSSGCGKSTIAHLIERFYDPNEGFITLDGHDLRELNVHWLRQQIGLVSQEPALFAATIRENIAHGLQGVATMEQIIAAAKVAHAYDFIMELSEGFETQVGNKGSKLSGGQKQRIAIARTIIKNPKILVLDEATSALDSESEHMVQRAIDTLLLEDSKRTTIVIAHRLSTIRNADVIVVLENGAIVESGTHDELLKRNGNYAALVCSPHGDNVAGTIKEEKASSLEAVSKSSILMQSSSTVSAVESKVLSDEDQTPLLRFRNVSFAYPARPNSTILRDFNLSVHHGETVAIVGASGSGKSTIVQLIERFYDPNSGSIELDGVDIRDYSPRWLRDQIGLVSQEPTLFDQSIADNLRFGLSDVNMEEIEQATEYANAYDFITKFPDGFETQVGESGTQVSGGQKQCICIARVLLRKPRLLLLDEATSALDSHSEQAVQEALDKIMKREYQSTIIIAHRMSTIRNADRIAILADGKIQEIGTYDELLSRKDGLFVKQELQESQGTAVSDESQANAKEPTTKHDGDTLELVDKYEIEDNEGQEIDQVREKESINRARQLARGDEKLFVVGSVGAILTGAVFPAWGFVFAYMIELLFTPVLSCGIMGIDSSSTCYEYRLSVADDMKSQSSKIALASVGTIVMCMVGYVILFAAFGTATERMSKRVRDLAYTALIRQEVGFFDTRPAGKLTTQLQDDAALIHSFSGEPIRTLVINFSSVVVGLVIGFVYMWPFALIFLGILPFLGFGAEMEMKMYVTGVDDGNDAEVHEDERSSGGLVMESLLNIRTVAALTLEELKLREFSEALDVENPRSIIKNYLRGAGFGLGQFFQFWGLGLMFWFGGWLLHTQPENYSFRDFNISMFGLFFSLYGMTVALEGATDRKRAKVAAGRIFNLVDRQSLIDPLNDQQQMDEKRVIGSIDDDTAKQ